jgi:hypothetical protein
MTKSLHFHYLIPVIPKTSQETWQDYLKVEVNSCEYIILVIIMIVYLLSLKRQTITLFELKSYKVSDIIKMLKDDNWYLVAQKGSHRQF